MFATRIGPRDEQGFDCSSSSCIQTNDADVGMFGVAQEAGKMEAVKRVYLKCSKQRRVIDCRKAVDKFCQRAAGRWIPEWENQSRLAKIAEGGTKS